MGLQFYAYFFNSLSCNELYCDRRIKVVKPKIHINILFSDIYNVFYVKTLLTLASSLASPFDKSAKVHWPKCKGKLKSIPIILSHKLLYFLALQQFIFKLTGQ